MAKPFMQVDLSAPGDFVPLIVQEGLPILDKWGSHASLMADWLGRFVAVVHWEGQTGKFYLRDDDQVQLSGIACEPATAADLRGGLKKEFEELKARLAQVVPHSDSARKLHQCLTQMLQNPQLAAGGTGRQYQFFKYRGYQGQWQLVFCLGYAPTAERALWTPAICSDPTCRLLTLVDSTGSRLCARCGKPVRTRSWLARHANQFAAALALLVLAAVLFYFYTRPEIGDKLETDVAEIGLKAAAQLRGNVVYTMGGNDRPVKGAEVSLAGQQTASEPTGEDGGFQLAGVASGPVRIRVTAAGFHPLEVDGQATVPPGSPLRVVLTGDGQLAGQVVHMRDEHIPVPEVEVYIEGLEAQRTSTDADGRFVLADVPPAPVQVWAAADGYRRIAIVADSLQAPLRVPMVGDATLVGAVTRSDTGEPVPGAAIILHGNLFRTETDDKGQFRLDGVPSGAVQIAASAPGLSAQLARELPANQETAVAIELTGEASVRGRVLSATDRRPVADASVAVAGTRLQTTTDEQGGFLLQDIPAAAVKLRIGAKSFMPMSVDEPLGEGERTLDDLLLIPAVGVSGQVVRAVDGQPVPDVEVMIAEPRLRTRTDDEGRFAFSDVPQVPIRIGTLAKRFRSQVVSVEAGKEPVLIRLVGDAALSGRVMRADTNQPAADAEVVLAGTPFATRSDPQGRFRLEGVWSGPAQIAASLPGLSAALASDLSPDQETTVDLLMAGDASVRGRVVHAADGHPVDGATITVAGTQWSVTSDAQGQFELAGLAAGPGTLQVAADDCLTRELVEELQNGQQSLDDVALQPAATVSGLVIRALDNTPLAQAQLTIDGVQVPTLTDRQGAFTFSGLPVGPTTFHIVATGYKPQEVSHQLVAGRQQLDQVVLVGDTPLAGVTRDADNPRQAVPNARVEVRVGGHVLPLTSDARGGFTVGDVPAGTVEVTAQAAGYRDARVRQQVGPGNARIDVSMTRLIAVRGQVIEAAGQRRAVPGANVSVRVDGLTQTAKTGPDGGFSVNVPPGLATASAAAEGFCDASVQKRLSPQDTTLVIPLLRGTNVRGTVVNAITGKPLAGATVAVAVGDVRQSDRSGADGAFNVSGVPAGGDAAISVTAPGFESDQRTHRTGGNDALRIVLSPVIPEGEVRIVLTWGARPRDLDAHLYGPLPGGGQFHVGFEDRQAPGVTLDVDAKTGWGPETITARVAPGTYRYYVADNANLGTNEGQDLARSNVQVRLYYQGAAQRPYVVPARAAGPVWHAFDIQVDQARQITIIPRNQFQRDLPAE
jgi:uncharacterized protein YfaP (DUF2135 family)